MTGIQPIYTPFSSISKFDGMPISGFSWEHYQVETIDSRGRRIFQSFDRDLKIQTQEAHDRLVSVFKNRRFLFSFTSLILGHEVKHIDIVLFDSFPLIKSLIVSTNQTIPISTLLKQPNLVILHINDSKIYWNPGEKHSLLSLGYRTNLEIYLQSKPYKFNYPSGFAFKSSFTLLNLLLLIGLKNIIEIYVTRKAEPSYVYLYEKRLYVSLCIAFASLILQYYVYTSLQQKKQNQSIEIIREPKKKS